MAKIHVVQSKKSDISSKIECHRFDAINSNIPKIYKLADFKHFYVTFNHKCFQKSHITWLFVVNAVHPVRVIRNE